MPIIQTIRDLFRSGATYIAEQFIRGTSKATNLSELLTRRFGPDLRITTEQIRAFESIVGQAARPASIIQSGGIPSESIIPDWLGSETPGMYITSGLAKYTVKLSGEPIHTTHIPFTFHDSQILEYQRVLDRLKLMASQYESGDTKDYYEQEIKRVEETLTYLQIIGSEVENSATLHGVYVGTP